MNSDQVKSSPRCSISIIDQDVVVADRKRKLPVTSRSVTWGSDVLLANHWSAVPAVSRADDDDYDCNDESDDENDGRRERTSPTVY